MVPTYSYVNGMYVCKRKNIFLKFKFHFSGSKKKNSRSCPKTGRLRNPGGGDRCGITVYAWAGRRGGGVKDLNKGRSSGATPPLMPSCQTSQPAGGGGGAFCILGDLDQDTTMVFLGWILVYFGYQSNKNSWAQTYKEEYNSIGFYSPELYTLQ